MRFEIETATLRGYAERGFNGEWQWEVTRAGITDEPVRFLLRADRLKGSLAEAIEVVLRQMADVARTQAESMETEIKAPNRSDR